MYAQHALAAIQSGSGMTRRGQRVGFSAFGDIVNVNDTVVFSTNLGWDTGLSNNSAEAIVADMLRQNGFQLVTYDRSALGFFGGSVTLAVRPILSAYAQPADVAQTAVGLINSQLGLSASPPYNIQALSVGAAVQPPSGGGDNSAATTSGGDGGYIYNAGVIARVTIPIPREPKPSLASNGGGGENPNAKAPDWIDQLAMQFGLSRQELIRYALYGGGGLVLFVLLNKKR